MFPKYDGLSIIPTFESGNELFECDCDLYDVLQMLEEGYDCARSKRAENTLERCVDRKNITFKAVVVKSYNFSLKEEVWVLTHFGRFTKRR